MRILIISCVFPPEPVVSAQISKDVTEFLVKSGFEVTVLVPTPSRPAGFVFYNDNEYYHKILPGAEIIRLSSYICPDSRLLGRMYESFSFGRAVSSYISDNKGKFNVAYINSWPLLSQYLIAKACVQASMKYAIHIQDIYPESLLIKLPPVINSVSKMLLMPIENYQLKHASKVIVISENMRLHLLKTRKLADGQFVIVHNWQDESLFSEIINKPSKSNTKFTFTYLGNIGPVAGVETLIKAFQRAKLKDCRLVIAGGGARKNACIKTASLTPDLEINFQDVPDGYVARIESEADVLLLPVIKGGAMSSIPSKLPSYMFASKPIIATLDLESDTSKAIQAAGCGWVGEPEDIEWLSEQMQLVSMMEYDNLQLLGKKGYEYSLNNFSKSVTLPKLARLIVALTGEYEG